MLEKTIIPLIELVTQIDLFFTFREANSSARISVQGQHKDKEVYPRRSIQHPIRTPESSI